MDLAHEIEVVLEYTQHNGRPILFPQHTKPDKATSYSES